MTASNKLTEAWQAGRKIVSAECRASGAAGREDAAKLAKVLPASLDAVVVADNPDEVRGCALATAAILAGQGLNTVLTMTTRDRNRVALESDALGAAGLGVGGVLCVSGDHQSLGCTVCGGCGHGQADGSWGRSCPVVIDESAAAYAAGRMTNLLGAWHSQLIEVLGAMGIREVRRLRGETGRAIFREDMEREAFGDLIRK